MSSIDVDEDSDEWEYEYDAQETQDFYVTLDLTSQVPPAQRRRFTSPASGGQTSEQDCVQILDLHSDNPLVSHQDKLYSCHWASAVGTDLLFTLPPESATTALADAVIPPTDPALNGTSKDNPLRATADYKILAATPHRLIGTPSVRKSKSDHATNTAAQSSAATMLQQQHLHKAGQRAAQADFLNKLTELKARRGDTDKVPMHTVNSVDRPRTIIRPYLTGTAAGAPWRSSTSSPLEGAQEAEDGSNDDTDSLEAGQDEETGDHSHIEGEEAEQASSNDDHERDHGEIGESDAGEAEVRQDSHQLSPSQPQRGAASLRGRGQARVGRTRRPLARENLIESLVGDADVAYTPRVRRSSKAKVAANAARGQSSDDIDMSGT